MFIPLIQKIITFADEENEFENLWEIKTIRFDVDPDEERKKIQKHLHGSYHVEDIKGNPGMRGHFFLTNLRVIWQAANDRYTNLSFGIDTIILVNIKTLPTNGGTGTKYLLIVKCENLSQTRYEFKFVGYSETEKKIFHKISDMHKNAVSTKSYRNVNLSLKCEPDFPILEKQEVKSTYENFIFYEDNEINDCRAILTNVRVVLIRKNSKSLNYGIPWIMIKSFQIIEHDDKNVLHLVCRGYLSRKRLLIRGKKGDELKKFHFQMKSFGETFNKNPIFGLKNEEAEEIQEMPVQNNGQIEQIEQTKVNLKKRKNAYKAQQTKGCLEETQFNEELGLMMEKLPEDVTRQDLWELLRQ